MSTLNVNTLKTEAAQISELRDLLRVGNATSSSADGMHMIELPDPLYRLLLRVLSDIVQGKPINYAPGTHEITTQQGADVLGMSRQFLVNLLNDNQIPYHRVGTHRRLYLKDVMEYRRKRDHKRHQMLGEIAREAVENGTYD